MNYNDPSRFRYLRKTDYEKILESAFQNELEKEKIQEESQLEFISNPNYKIEQLNEEKDSIKDILEELYRFQDKYSDKNFNKKKVLFVDEIGGGPIHSIKTIKKKGHIDTSAHNKRRNEIISHKRHIKKLHQPRLDREKIQLENQYQTIKNGDYTNKKFNVRFNDKDYKTISEEYKRLFVFLYSKEVISRNKLIYLPTLLKELEEEGLNEQFKSFFKINFIDNVLITKSKLKIKARYYDFTDTIVMSFKFEVSVYDTKYVIKDTYDKIEDTEYYKEHEDEIFEPFI